MTTAGAPYSHIGDSALCIFNAALSNLVTEEDHSRKSYESHSSYSRLLKRARNQIQTHSVDVTEMAWRNVQKL